MIEKKLRSFKQLPQALVNQARMLVGRHRYTDAFEDRGGLAHQLVFCDGKLMAQIPTYTYCSDKRYFNPRYQPLFAVGRCIDISDGDYKTVYIDQDGNSDYVIKKYDYHTYRGEKAWERAEAAGKKMRSIFNLLHQLCGPYVLPNEIIVDQVPGDDNEIVWGVYEKQQRAIFCSPWLFGVEEAGKRWEEAKKASKKLNPIIKRELIRRGICRWDSAWGGIDFAEMHFDPASWDARTNHFVADDIIDYVHIDDPRYPKQ